MNGGIFPGNGKLGPGIWSWSLPAITTCPGRSKECEKLCYATSGFFAMPSVTGTYRKNWETAKAPDFSRRMLAQILVNRVDVLRIHVSGDFYDAAYTAKWLTIVRAARRTTFYCYTRSWRDPKILPHLLALAREPNVQLWFSWDRAMPYPPRVRRVRIAYMSVNDADVPEKHVDLVFRTNRRSAMKFLGKALVCPHEQGLQRKSRLTCTTCRICFEPDRFAAVRRSNKSRLARNRQGKLIEVPRRTRRKV